ncbi:MAG: hypothetical protein HUJ25_06740 [Crocinitomicaceae bacterium]|nr:hypothetical protein [Crocinitomicaceae bacterium]
MEIVISVIGFGKIGKLISALLTARKDMQLVINIVDTDTNVWGAILDLEHGLQLFPNQHVVFNSDHYLEESDFIFHCAGASVPKGKTRLFTAQASIEITESIFNNLHFKKPPFIIVVSNPVDIITHVTQRLTDIDPGRIVGTGTYLDSARLKHHLFTRNHDYKNVEAIMLGEHGDSMFISQELSKINGEPINQYFDESELSQMEEHVKTSAEEIKRTQDATIFGVSFCAVRVFESFLDETKFQCPVSISAPEWLIQETQIPQVSLSLFSELSNSGAKTVNYHPNESELSKLSKSAEIISSYVPNKYL